MKPPYIIKSTKACGVADAHSMALVVDNLALSDLKIETPAVVQEFVNHKGWQTKVYVMKHEVMLGYETCAAFVSSIHHEHVKLASHQLAFHHQC